MPGPAQHYLEAMKALRELEEAMGEQKRRGCPNLEQAKELGEHLGEAAANVVGAQGEEGYEALLEAFTEQSIAVTSFLGACERRRR